MGKNELRPLASRGLVVALTTGLLAVGALAGQSPAHEHHSGSGSTAPSTQGDGCPMMGGQSMAMGHTMGRMGAMNGMGIGSMMGTMRGGMGMGPMMSRTGMGCMMGMMNGMGMNPMNGMGMGRRMGMGSMMGGGMRGMGPMMGCPSAGDSRP